MRPYRMKTTREGCRYGLLRNMVMKPPRRLRSRKRPSACVRQFVGVACWSYVTGG